MRKDTTFSERKLTQEEFSEKYWLHGRVPYQYHTASIEDGRDEREQFIFNNIRALYNLHENHVRRLRKAEAELLEAKRIAIKQRKENFMTIMLAVIILIISILIR